MIEVWWQKRICGGYSLIEELAVKIVSKEGKVYAHFPGSTRIQVADNLAIELLGETQAPCPYTGSEPVWGRLTGKRYCCSEYWSPERAISEYCGTCGFSRELKWGDDSAKVLAETDGVRKHPPRTITTYAKSSVIVSDLSGWAWNWETETLEIAPPDHPYDEVIFLRGTHLRRGETEKAAEEAYGSEAFLTRSRGWIHLAVPKGRNR